MTQIQINDSIPVNYRVPGIYMKLDYSTSAPFLPNKRVLLLAYRVAGADGAAGELHRLFSQSDADRYSGHRGADGSRGYAAVAAQLRAGSGVEIYYVPLDEPSGGVAATHLFWFVPPFISTTSAQDTNTSAQAPGVIDVWICGLNCPLGVQAGDDWNTLAANFVAGLEPYKDYLPATASIIGESVTWGTGNAAFTVRALASPRYIVVTQQTGLTKSLITAYDTVTGILSIQLGTDGAGAANTTGTALKTSLDGIAELANNITYAFGGNGAGIIGVLALQLLPFRIVAFTMRHKGDVGNDFPIRVRYSNSAMRVGIVAGKFTLATNAAATPGQHTINANTKSFTYALSAAQTPAAAATAMAVAMNLQSFPLDAGYNGADVWLYYTDQRVVHRLTASTTDSAQTVALFDRIQSGVIASMTAAAGVPTTLQGQGNPNLTVALTTLGSAQPFLVWAHPFSGDSTTLGLIAAHIERYQDSPYDKGQTAHTATTLKLSAAASIPTGSTPRLTSSPRYAVSICPGAWEQAWEMACRTAALVAQLIDYPPKNYDGQRLLGSETAPLHVPDDAEKMSLDDLQLAMASFYLTPLQGDEDGYLSIVSDTTTWKPGDLRLARWGGVLTMDYDRDSLKVFLRPVVRGKNIKAHSEGYTANTVTPERIKTATFDWMTDQDKLDIYDGAQALFQQVDGAQNPQNPSRYDLQLPMRWPTPLSVVGVRGFMVQP